MDALTLTPTIDPQSPTGVYIPANLEDCFLELDKMLPAGMRESLRTAVEADLSRHHFGLGLWLRNNWRLWSASSHLRQYFDKLGVHHADSISSLILASYWRYLNSKPLELPRQIVYDKIGRSEIEKGHRPSS